MLSVLEGGSYVGVWLPEINCYVVVLETLIVNWEITKINDV